MYIYKKKKMTSDVSRQMFHKVCLTDSITVLKYSVFQYNQSEISCPYKTFDPTY